MTREKKEILKKVEAIDNLMECDRELGCGFSPEGAYSEAEQTIYKLYERLAKLSHYNTVEEMMYDERQCVGGY